MKNLWHDICSNTGFLSTQALSAGVGFLFFKEFLKNLHKKTKQCRVKIHATQRGRRK